VAYAIKILHQININVKPYNKNDDLLSISM